VVAFFEHGDELPGSIKRGEFLDHLRDYQLLNKDFIRFSSAVLKPCTVFCVTVCDLCVTKMLLKIASCV
jgi:hypothetical protein